MNTEKFKFADKLKLMAAFNNDLFSPKFKEPLPKRSI